MAVGCGWRPKSWSVLDLDPNDFANDPDGFGKCERCFKAHDFPAHWGTEDQEVQVVAQDTDSSLDSGSDTDDSVDTESDLEGVDLPEILKVVPTE